MKKHYTVLFLLFLSSFLLAQENEEQDASCSYEELDSLITIHERNKNYAKTFSLHQKKQEKLKKEFGEQDTTFAESLNELAFLYKKIGKYKKALPLYLQSKDVIEEVLGKRHIRFVSALREVAELYTRMGNNEKALLLAIECKNIAEAILEKKNTIYQGALNLLAIIYLKMGNHEKALPLLLELKDITEEVFGKEHPNVTRVLNNLALLYYQTNQYEKAIILFIQINSIREKVLGNKHPEFASSLNNLASVYKTAEYYENALPLYIQSKDIREEILGRTHPDFATSLNNLAELYTKMGDYEKALPLYIQSKDIREEVFGRRHPKFATSLNNLAELYIIIGDYETSKKIIKEVIESLSGLSLAPTFTKEWADSLKVVSYASFQHIYLLVNSLNYIYELLEKDSQVRHITEYKSTVVDLALNLLTQTTQQLSNDKDKLLILESNRFWIQRYLGILNSPEGNRQAFELVDGNKSILLNQANQVEATYRLGNLPDSLVVADKNNRKKRSQLQAQLLEKRSKEDKEKLRDQLNNIHGDMDQLESLIKEKYPKYYQLQYEQITTSTNDIQASLDEETVLLEYVIDDSLVHLFCIDKQEGLTWYKIPVVRKKLNQQIDSLHESLSDYNLIIERKEAAYRQYTEQAYWFYRNLVAPALQNKPQIKKLVIVTDGKLGHIPFEIFLVKEAPGQKSSYKKLNYLVNDYAISYNYSATLWKKNMEKVIHHNNGQMMAMTANYTLKNGSNPVPVRLISEQELRTNLEHLPAAHKEVKFLQKKFKGYFAFNEDASEKNIKEKAGDYAILHFAMHGILDDRRPVLSSLAMTEDGDDVENNFLQAYEISRMELNADLVVLSACETGYGRFEDGNGIASLARSFMYAGASSLVVSLWQVNDVATAVIMEKFYEYLSNGLEKDEALRQAKLAYRKTTTEITAHPTFWSAFIQLGNNSPIHIATKSSGMWWWGVGGLLLVGICFVFRKRRSA